jgi:L-arabinose transport system ATP-binding protein
MLGLGRQHCNLEKQQRMSKAINAGEMLAVQNVEVRFPGVLALNKVSLSVNAGEVLGLMGENGAGKSTLLKVLSGVNKPAAGSIHMHGQHRQFANEKDALEAGIAIIYQELHLVPELTVAENLLLGHWPHKQGFIDNKRLLEMALSELALLGETINPQTKIKHLSIGQRQMVEIGKALMRHASVIAFDEPTSSLSARETDHLMRIIKSLRDKGCAIIYVTHRMEEMYRICDRVSVLRDGVHVETFNKVANTDQADIIRAMVGRSINDMYAYRPRLVGKPLLQVDNIHGPGLNAPASLNLCEGEIVGIFGLVGAGRTELMRLIYGAEKSMSGRVSVHGQYLTEMTPVEAKKNGLGLCPEDRKGQGIIPNASVSDNINIGCRDKTAWRKIMLNLVSEKEIAKQFIKKLAVKTPSDQARIVNLSGGNQQKVILARWMASDTKVFLLDEPTRGIDVGAKSEIYELMYQMAESGKGLLVVSSDLAEIIGISDRILVMNSGRLVGEVAKKDASPEMLMRMALPTS